MTSARAGDPAAGVTVAVTHEQEPADELLEILEGHGIRVLHWSAVRTVPPADPGPLRAAVAGLERYDWIVFTSRRAVAAVVERRRELPAGVQVAVVGPRVAAAVDAAGWPVALVGDGNGAAMAQALRFRVSSRDWVLFPSAEVASTSLAHGLEPHVSLFHRVSAYRTEGVAVDAPAHRRTLQAGGVQAITFLSPSAVRSLTGALEPEGVMETLFALPAVCIGPTTAGEARGAGFQNVVESATASKQAVGLLLAEVLGARAAVQLQPSP